MRSQCIFSLVFSSSYGKKYSTLKNKDIVFVSLDGKFDKQFHHMKKGIPSSEWKFHQDIYKNKKEYKAIVHAHSTNATAVSTHNKGIDKKNIPPFSNFHYLLVAMAMVVAMTLNVQNMQPLEQENYLKIF